MTNTVKIHVPPSQQTMRNRTYSCHMRNLYYEKSSYQFRKIKKSSHSKNPPNETEHLQELYKFEEFLNVCLSYAKSAIYSGKSEKILPFSQDHRWGILQEEIVLIHFLEEQISNVKYIINQIEINMKIQDFANKNKIDVLVNHILYNINEFKKNTEEDLRYFYDKIENRYKIGNKLFGYLQELQNFQ
jgi:hypothetical protein